MVRFMINTSVLSIILLCFIATLSNAAVSQEAFNEFRHFSSFGTFLHAWELGNGPASQLGGFQDALAFWHSFKFDYVTSQSGVPTVNCATRTHGRLCL